MTTEFLNRENKKIAINLKDLTHFVEGTGFLFHHKSGMWSSGMILA